MAPRATTLPSAQTESARELRSKFFCDMCNKGYARSTDFDAHENSYDHQHRKRLKEMKQLTRNVPTAKENRDLKKRKEKEEMMSVNLQANESGARPSNVVGFKDATQVKSAVPSDQNKISSTEQGQQEGQQDSKPLEKVMRPPNWQELGSFYSLIDANVLPEQMQDKEAQLPWARIWSDQGEMEKLRQAVGEEMQGLEDGAARQELQRVWDSMEEDTVMLMDELDSESDA